MTAQIGSLQFTTLKGQNDTQAEQLERIERPGIDGAMFVRVGERGNATQWQSSEDVSSIGTKIAGYKALQGTVVTVVDEFGTSHTNMLVLKVEPQPTEPIAYGVGGLTGTSGRYVLHCIWTLESLA